MDEWMNKIWYRQTYSGIFFSLTEEGHSDTFYNMMNPEDVILSEISQSHTKTNTVYPTCMRYLELSNLQR